LTNHPDLGFEMGKEQVINLIEREFNFTHCPISINIVGNA